MPCQQSAPWYHERQNRIRPRIAPSKVHESSNNRKKMLGTIPPQGMFSTKSGTQRSFLKWVVYRCGFFEYGTSYHTRSCQQNGSFHKIIYMNVLKQICLGKNKICTSDQFSPKSCLRSSVCNVFPRHVAFHVAYIFYKRGTRWLSCWLCNMLTKSCPGDTYCNTDVHCCSWTFSPHSQKEGLKDERPLNEMCQAKSEFCHDEQSRHAKRTLNKRCTADGNESPAQNQPIQPRIIKVTCVFVSAT